MTTDTKTTLLPAARLAEIRETFAAYDNGETEVDAQSLADFMRDLLAHLDAITAPVPLTREGRVQRLATIARELFSIGEAEVTEYLARDAEIARLAAELAEARARVFEHSAAETDKRVACARREGARDERRLCVLDVRREMASQEKASFALRVAERAMLARGDEPAPVEGEDGAT